MGLSNAILDKGLRRVRILSKQVLLRSQASSTGVAVNEPLTHAECSILVELAVTLRSAPRVIYDIGASEGIFADLFAKMASIDSVYAFEPLPSSFEKLRERSSNRPNMTVMQVALSDSNTDATFYESAVPDSSSFLPMAKLHRSSFPFTAEIRNTVVPLRRLDDLVAEYGIPLPDLVKIDVQGFEDRVLKGGKRSISAAKVVIVEMSFVSLYEGSVLFDELHSVMSDLCRIYREDSCARRPHASGRLPL